MQCFWGFKMFTAAQQVGLSCTRSEGAVGWSERLGGVAHQNPSLRAMTDNKLKHRSSVFPCLLSLRQSLLLRRLWQEMRRLV